MTDLTERLRVAWMRVQAAKRNGKPDLEPVWEIINLVPAVIAALDEHDAFERELEAEAREDAALESHP